jgi:hypothetical protein
MSADQAARQAADATYHAAEVARLNGQLLMIAHAVGETLPLHVQHRGAIDALRWFAAEVKRLQEEKRAMAADVARLTRERDEIESLHLRLSIDVDRLYSGNYRAAYACNQWMCDILRERDEARAERDRLRAACELTLRWLRGEVIERSVRDAIAEALAQPGDGAAGGGRG